MSAETGLTEDENQELFKGLTETEKQELIQILSDEYQKTYLFRLLKFRLLNKKSEVDKTNLIEGLSLTPEDEIDIEKEDLKKLIEGLGLTPEDETELGKDLGLNETEKTQVKNIFVILIVRSKITYLTKLSNRNKEKKIKENLEKLDNNKKNGILTYFTILHMLFPEKFTSDSSEVLKKIIEYGGIERIPNLFFYDVKKENLISKIDEIKKLFEKKDLNDDKKNKILNSDDDNVKILQKEFKLDVETINQVLKEKQYGEYEKQLGILNEKEQEVGLNKKMHADNNQYDERAKQWVDFFNIFIDRHYTTVSPKNISSRINIQQELKTESGKILLEKFIEHSISYFNKLKKLLNDANLLVLGEHPLSNSQDLYTVDNRYKISFEELQNDYNTIILVILISELIAINSSDYIGTIITKAATNDEKSSSAEEQQDGQKKGTSIKKVKHTFYKSVNNLPANIKSVVNSAKNQKGDMSQLNSMNAAKSFCQNLLDNTKKIETELNTNLQTQFGITIKTDDTVSNNIISDIVSYIEMITIEKQLKSQELKPEGGKKSRKKRRKKTRKKKKQTKKRKTKRYKKPTRRRK